MNKIRRNYTSTARKIPEHTPVTCYTKAMRKTLEASKVLPYLALFAVVLFCIFAYKLFNTVESRASPLSEKMDAKVDAINSIPKGNKKN